jgi:hypothetical protein
MPPAGFEPVNPVSEWPKTHALDRAATGIGWDITSSLFIPQTVRNSDCIVCSESLFTHHPTEINV